MRFTKSSFKIQMDERYNFSIEEKHGWLLEEQETAYEI